MFEIIEKIRHKPEGIKKQIAFGLSFLITGLIFVIWISILYPNWKTGQDNENKITSAEPSPLSTITSTFSDGIKNISGQFGKAKSLLSSVVQSVEQGTTTPLEAVVVEQSTEQEPGGEQLQIIATTTEPVGI
jgi:hypothetical protein